MRTRKIRIPKTKIDYAYWGALIYGYVLSVVLQIFLALPYRMRVRVSAAFGRRFMGPLLRMPATIRKNLSYIYPAMRAHEMAQIMRGSIDNLSRTIMEVMSGEKLLERAKGWKIDGPGGAQFAQIKAQNIPAVMVCGHLGNPVALVAHMSALGHKVALMYSDMKNPIIQDLYVRRLEKLNILAISRHDKGAMRKLLRFMKAGGSLFILSDQYTHGGKLLNFMGKPAKTALTPAKIALKYEALFIPYHSIRKANGIDFEFIIQEPIAPTNAEMMMQVFNDRLSEKVHRYPAQWLWSHDRWRPVGG